MSKLNILITGINGFIGKSLYDFLKFYDINVFGLDVEMNKNDNYSRLVDFYILDVSKIFKLKTHFDFVFHFAAVNQTHIGKKTYSIYHKVNVLGTENVIKALNFDKFVFMSSAKIYEMNGVKIDESSPVLPIAEYEKSKLEAEKVCKNNIKKEKLIIFRPINIVGPGQGQKAILPVFFQKALMNLPINVFAPKKSILQLLYISDIIKAFQLIIESREVSGIYNLSSKDKISINKLAEEIVRITNSKSRIIYSNNEESNFSEITSQKAKKILNWEPEININDMLYLYFRNNPI